MGNERDHCLMGRLFSKVRASLRADNFEMLVLRHHYLLLEFQASTGNLASRALLNSHDPVLTLRAGPGLMMTLIRISILSSMVLAVMMHGVR